MDEYKRKLSPIYFVAIPDARENKRSAGAQHTLVVSLMTYRENGDGDRVPVQAGTLNASVDEDGRVTFSCTLEKKGRQPQWIRETYDPLE